MAKDTSAVPAVEVKQWMPSWDQIKFDPKAFQGQPPKSFCMFSMKASHLKALTGVYRRTVKSGKPRAMDQNIQRGHEVGRSEVIREYIKYGFPWCEMSEAKRNTSGARDLLKPGWIPTAILVNILSDSSIRNGVKLSKKDKMSLKKTGDRLEVLLPENFSGGTWSPESIFPIEVIDGQHRLWAFEGFDPGEDYELPVIAFFDLDRSWQAYLFWSVNITPKKINRSLAFDLYPLLRQEDWLDRFTGHSIYRETRAQELVEALWGNSQSPWFKRINMLGETSAQRESKAPMVTQAAWIRSLMSTFIKQWEGAGTRIGGLFGASPKEDSPVLPWNRPMQAAFLIHASTCLKKAVQETKSPWAKQLRGFIDKDRTLFNESVDQAFFGQFSLLTTDQGIRGFLTIANDLCFLLSDELKLDEWNWDSIAGGKSKLKPSAVEEDYVSVAVKSLKKTDMDSFLTQLGEGLASYDWRTSATPGLSDQDRQHQAIFRGSSGYKELRMDLLKHLSKKQGLVGRSAKEASRMLGFA